MIPHATITVLKSEYSPEVDSFVKVRPCEDSESRDKVWNAAYFSRADAASLIYLTRRKRRQVAVEHAGREWCVRWKYGTLFVAEAIFPAPLPVLLLPSPAINSDEPAGALRGVPVFLF